MRSHPPTSLLPVLIVLCACTATAASTPDVAVDGGVAACVHTPVHTHATGTADDQRVVVAADSGTLAIAILGSFNGAPGGDGCSFDVAITGGAPVGLSATSPRAGVSDATSTPCSLSAHGSCAASARATWFVNGLDARATAVVSAKAAVPFDIVLDGHLTNGLNPSHPPSAALGVDVAYEIGVTANGVRTVVATGSVEILDSPVGASAEGNPVP